MPYVLTFLPSSHVNLVATCFLREGKFRVWLESQHHKNCRAVYSPEFIKYMLFCTVIIYQCRLKTFNPFLHHSSKTRNWIARWVLDTLTVSNIRLKAMINSFPTHPRTSRTSQNRQIYEVISSTPPPAPFIKNPKLNGRMSTGHIDSIKHSSESYDK